MSPTARIRRLASAACLIVAPLLFLAAVATGPLNAESETVDSLALFAENPDAVNWSDVFALASVLAMIPALLAVMRVLRRTAPVLSLVGGSLAIAGWAAMLCLVGTDQINLGVSEASVRAEAAAAIDNGPGWAIGVMFATFLLGRLIGMILLGVAALRTRVVPAWAGVALIAAVPVEISAYAVFEAKAVAVAGAALTVAGLAAVAQRVLSAGDAQWEAADFGPLGGRTTGAAPAAA